MKRPFVVVVSFYAFGLLLAAILQPPPLVLFAASFLTLVLVIAIARWRPFLLCALLVLAGWTNLVFRTAIISPNDLRRLIGDKTELVSVRGVLVRSPSIKLYERRGSEIPHSQAQLRVAEIELWKTWQPADGVILVSTPGLPGPGIFAGQSVEISGIIERPPIAIAGGLFNDRDYLQTRGIFYELRTRSAEDWRLRAPVLPRPPLTDRFLAWSKRVLALGLPEDQTLRLLWAMTLGWRTAFTGDVGDPYLRAGTMHLFAIDGLRIGLISGMLVTLLRVLQVSRGWCGAVAIPAIWFYTAATGWESSAVRASLMMTVVLGGWSLKRPADLLNSLGGAAFLILLWDPRQLFEASFQLSFFVMLTIALLLPRLNDLSGRLLEHDPLLPSTLVPNWRRSLTQAARYSARYFSLSLAAWVGCIPLSAFYFHLFSPISTLANVIAVPLGTFALMANLGALLCGAWLPLASALFNNAAWFLMLEMGNVSEWFTRIPGSYSYVRAPSWIWIAIYYGVMVFLLGGWANTTRRRIFSATFVVLLTGVYLASAHQWRNATTLTVLPLEGGHAVFMNSGSRKYDCLIDCGSAYAVNFTVKPFIEAQGLNSISRLVLTEGDSKNCGGAVTLDNFFGVHDLGTSPARFRSPVYKKIIADFERSPRRHEILHCRHTFGPWRVLWPPDDSENSMAKADDNALVLLGNFYGRKVLLLSDLSPDGQDRLLSSGCDLRADVVVAGLPNKGEPLSDALTDAIQPRLIVIADSQFPFSRDASKKLRRRLDKCDVPVVYTSDSGAVKIIMDEKGWTWSAAWPSAK
ncbi:MAG: ComEC/Rec2 family competence protein [Limisphaerales bacterium]